MKFMLYQEIGTATREYFQATGITVEDKRNFIFDVK